MIGTSAVALLAEAGVPDQYDVTPGLLGFLVTFAIAIAFLFLVRSFNKNMRKVQLNERRRQEVAAQEAATQEAEAEAAANDPETPDAETPDAETPDAETPDAETPAAGTEAGSRG